MAPAVLATRPIPTGLAPTSFTATEWNELTAALTPGAPGLRSPRVRLALDRLLAPVIDASIALGFCNTIVCAVQRIMLQAMWTRGTAWGAWDAATWQAVARTAGNRFCANVLCVAVHIAAITGAEALSAERLEPTKLARRLFGAEALDREVTRVRLYLRTVGYGRHSDSHSSLLAAVSRLLVQAGRAELEAITLEALERAHEASPARSAPSMAYYRLAHALHGMGLLPRGIRRRAYPTAPLTDVDPVWVEWCERWRRTTTLAPNTAQRTYYGALKAGRWLLREHPAVRTPEDWTRDLALAYLTAINQGIVGDLVASNVRFRQRRGTPLAARSKAWLLSTIRRFFIDCQEWGWCATHFDPTRTLATPRSVKALIGPNPRVLADDVWAKLLWAGLQLEEADLPTSPPSFGRPGRGWPTYPLALVKATAVAWLFTGLRSDELSRLRVGCIRWQAPDGGPGAGVIHTPGDGATCLLDVPTHKTGGSYTKPVDPLVGDVFAAWEVQRKPQPLFVDRKTHERVALIFAWRGRSLAALYFNKTLIPLLCRKAGVPQQDARGRITSHRARATIATQLYNAKEPMTLFELQAWLGHRSPETTQHYARITPTTLAKAYHDAGYFARNVRTIEVLIDREAVENGAAATGTPWQYFDLGHGLCTYSFFEQCPHRMACARCDFYVPKDSTKAQLLEAKGNLQRMLAEIRLTDDERAAVTEGANAVDNLLERLTDVPTPAGPTPRELAGSSFIPLTALGSTADNASTQDLLKTNGDNPVDF